MIKNRIVITGVSESGKTLLARNLIGKVPFDQRIIIYDPNCEYEVGVEANNYKSFFDYLECDERIIRVVFDDDSKEKFDDICEIVFNQRNVYFFIDEIHDFCRGQYTPEKLNRIIRRGRHRGISIVGIGQRPPDVSRSLTSQATHLICFQQHEPRDVKYFSSVMPDAPGMNELKQFEFICYSVRSRSFSKGRVNFKNGHPEIILKKNII